MKFSNDEIKIINNKVLDIKKRTGYNLTIRWILKRIKQCNGFYTLQDVLDDLDKIRG